MARAEVGVSTGSDPENYVYSDSTGGRFHHVLAASQGYLTQDTYLTHC